MEKAIGLICLALALATGGCAQDRPNNAPQQESAGTAMSAESTAQEPEVVPMQGEEDAQRATMTVNGTAFDLELDSSPTAQAFAELLPLRVEMAELNGNEKYVYLDAPLPADPRCPQTIEAGDVMLYGDSCLVVFYESFSTSYSYTRIGRLTDASGLAQAAGTGGTTVAFTAE